MVYLKYFCCPVQKISNKNKRLRSAILCLGALSLSVSLAFAQQPTAQPNAQPDEGPTFDIKRFDLTGNTLLSNERIQSLIAPYVGTKRSLADIQRAQSAIEAAYRELGYGVVQVTLP